MRGQYVVTKKGKVFLYTKEGSDILLSISDESSFSKCMAKGIRSQSELDNERLNEIVDAVVRYRKSEMAIPTEWIEEYNSIIERIKNNPK